MDSAENAGAQGGAGRKASEVSAQANEGRLAEQQPSMADASAAAVCFAGQLPDDTMDSDPEDPDRPAPQADVQSLAEAAQPMAEARGTAVDGAPVEPEQQLPAAVVSSADEGLAAQPLAAPKPEPTASLADEQPPAGQGGAAGKAAVDPAGGLATEPPDVAGARPDPPSEDEQPTAHPAGGPPEHESAAQILEELRAVSAAPLLNGNPRAEHPTAAPEQQPAPLLGEEPPMEGPPAAACGDPAPDAAELQRIAEPAAPAFQQDDSPDAQDAAAGALEAMVVDDAPSVSPAEWGILPVADGADEAEPMGEGTAGAGSGDGEAAAEAAGAGMEVGPPAPDSAEPATDPADATPNPGFMEADPRQVATDEASVLEEAAQAKADPDTEEPQDKAEEAKEPEAEATAEEVDGPKREAVERHRDEDNAAAAQAVESNAAADEAKKLKVVGDSAEDEVGETSKPEADSKSSAADGDQGEDKLPGKDEGGAEGSDAPKKKAEETEEERDARETVEKAKAEEVYEEQLELLRSNWMFASTMQFFRIFIDPLRLRRHLLNSDLLEGAIMRPWDNRLLMGELLFKLLRSSPDIPYSDKDCNKWEVMLEAKMRHKWQEHFEANPLEDKSYFGLLPSERMHIMYLLCEWRLVDCHATREALKRTVEHPDYTSDALRHNPIGEDSKGNTYYYFAIGGEDCRMYQLESPYFRRPRARKTRSKSKKTRKRTRDVDDDDDEEELVEVDEPQWSTVCTTLEEMQDWAEQLGKSRNPIDKSLHQLVVTEILPKLVETANARKRALEKQLLYESLPKKRSSRIQVQQQQKEEEARLAKIREAEEAERRAAEEARLAEEAKLAEKQRREEEREARTKARAERLEQRRQEWLAIMGRGQNTASAKRPTREERLAARLAKEGQKEEEVEKDKEPQPPASEGLTPMEGDVQEGVRAKRRRFITRRQVAGMFEHRAATRADSSLKRCSPIPSLVKFLAETRHCRGWDDEERPEAPPPATSGLQPSETDRKAAWLKNLQNLQKLDPNLSPLLGQLGLEARMRLESGQGLDQSFSPDVSSRLGGGGGGSGGASGALPMGSGATPQQLQLLRQQDQRRLLQQQMHGGLQGSMGPPQGQLSGTMHGQQMSGQHSSQQQQQQGLSQGMGGGAPPPGMQLSLQQQMELQMLLRQMAPEQARQLAAMSPQQQAAIMDQARKQNQARLQQQAKLKQQQAAATPHGQNLGQMPPSSKMGYGMMPGMLGAGMPQQHAVRGGGPGPAMPMPDILRNPISSMNIGPSNPSPGSGTAVLPMTPGSGPVTTPHQPAGNQQAPSTGNSGALPSSTPLSTGGGPVEATPERERAIKAKMKAGQPTTDEEKEILRLRDQERKAANARRAAKRRAEKKAEAAKTGEAGGADGSGGGVAPATQPPVLGGGSSMGQQASAGAGQFQAIHGPQGGSSGGLSTSNGMTGGGLAALRASMQIPGDLPGLGGQPKGSPQLPTSSAGSPHLSMSAGSQMGSQHGGGMPTQSSSMLTPPSWQQSSSSSPQGMHFLQQQQLMSQAHRPGGPGFGMVGMPQGMGGAGLQQSAPVSQMPFRSMSSGNPSQAPSMPSDPSGGGRLYPSSAQAFQAKQQFLQLTHDQQQRRLMQMMGAAGGDMGNVPLMAPPPSSAGPSLQGAPPRSAPSDPGAFLGGNQMPMWALSQQQQQGSPSLPPSGPAAQQTPVPASYPPAP
mmetsp:Transcript_7133/g.20132  ORF Transcript_7133/g.20132 Transcript_7133/m.20132 type:complete len:1701 (-) Transcript_7133:554-5656(-)